MIGINRGSRLAPVTRRERGQSLVLFIFGLAALLGFTALTIDVGLAWVARRDMQNTADAAALAGGDVLLEGGLVSEAKVAALDLALQNGYDNADPDDTVTVNIPPASGPHVGNPDYVEVIIEHPVDAVISRALGKTSWKMSARAVAEISRVPKPYSIIALSETDCPTMQVSGQVSVTIVDAGTFTNSACPADAFFAEGGITVSTDANHVVGEWTISGGSGSISPPPSRAGHYGDPLAGVPEPTPPNGPVRACPTWSGSVGTVNLQPGVYDCLIDPPGSWSLRFLPGDYLITGGIVLDGNNDADFGAGVYSIGGVGLIVTGNGIIVGDSVTFYVYEGQVVLTGTGDVDLTAPKTGDYAGVLIFQSRTLTSTVELSGNAITEGWGTVYALGAQIHVTGTATTGYQFISDTFLTDGTTDIHIDFFNGVLLAVPIMHLVE